MRSGCPLHPEPLFQHTASNHKRNYVRQKARNTLSQVPAPRFSISQLYSVRAALFDTGES